MVDLGHGGYRALAATAGGPLLDADRRRQARDEVHLRSGHGIGELARVGAHRVQKPALPFGKEDVESERALAGTADTRHHHKFPARNIHGDVPQIMLPRSLDADELRCSGRLVLILRHALRMVLLCFVGKRCHADPSAYSRTETKPSSSQLSHQLAIRIRKRVNRKVFG